MSRPTLRAVACILSSNEMVHYDTIKNQAMRTFREVYQWVISFYQYLDAWYEQNSAAKVPGHDPPYARAVTS